MAIGIDGNERPTKKIRVDENDKEAQKNEVQHRSTAEEADGNVSVSTDLAGLREVFDNAQKTPVDAETFLFRSPATNAEIDEIAEKIKSQIENVHAQISQIGYEAYRKLRRRNSSTDSSGGKNSGAGAGIGETSGVDTDDEMTQDKKEIEKAAALEEAVVRGNPRRYQTALVELAKKQNTIVNLGTGQGKTLIALLLIRHFAQVEDAYRKGKQTLFLVPSVALATQHTTTLQANLPYTVATACHNSTKANGSRERMAEANILVATHGAARDLFMHYGDMFSFDRINLLVVDECHYTSGEHGYATIMRNFYHRLPREKRPRVLGLTASPLVNIKSDVDDDKLGQMLRELEQRLDSRLASLTKIMETDDMGYDIQDAEERCVHYHRTNNFAVLPSHEGIGLHESRVKEFNQFLDLYHDLGPKVTSIYSATVAREISMNRYDEESKEQFSIARKHLHYISDFCAKQSKNSSGGRSEKLAVLEQLLEDIIESKGARNTVGVVFVDRRITALALYDYFRNRSKGISNGTWVRVKDTEFDRTINKSIVNTIFAPKLVTDQKNFDLSNRQFQEMNFGADELDAAVINDVLQDALPKGMTMETLMDIEPSPTESCKDGSTIDQDSINKQHRTIKCDMIVRQCTSVFKYLDRSHHYSDEKNADSWLHKLQRVKEVLDGLRTKRTNVLIATSVVEEGVDVDACSFVIVLDNIRSTKGYVQMKGRARQKNARFFVFQDTSLAESSGPYMHLQSAQTADLRVKTFIESRSEYIPPLVDPVIRFQAYVGHSIQAEQDALLRGEYRTNMGFIDVSTAKPLLNRYTLSIPLEAASRSTRDLLGMHLPQFEKNRLMLPAHIPSSARCVLLPEKYKHYTKKEKQNILSLMGCVRLHKLNLLNDRLLPLRRKDMQNKLLSVALTDLFTVGDKVAQEDPPAHSESNLVYVYKLIQKGKSFEQNDSVLCGGHTALCLVTLVPLAINSTSITFQHIEIGEISVTIKKLQETRLNSDEWEWCTKFHTVLMNARWRKRTGSSFYIYNTEKINKQILPSYVVGCLTKDGTIDWERIKRTVTDYGRTEEERIEAVRASSEHNDLKSARIWTPIYDPHVSYISYGPSKLDGGAPFPTQDEDIKTYSDYFTKRREFDVKDSSILFAVQRHWYMPRKMPRKPEKSGMFGVWKKKLETECGVDSTVLKDGERCPCEGLVAALMPIDACLEAPIADASLMLHCLILPQVLYHMDRLTTAQLFVEHCAEKLPILGSHLRNITKDSFDDVLEAITAKSCVLEGINYDRLEWLGDAVLKLIHTDALLHSKDLRQWVSYLHEGDLSVLRSAMGSNNRLMNATKAAGFDRFILFRQLGRSQWVPSGLELHEIKEDGIERLANVEEEQAGKKTNADIIESILGLIYLKVDFKAAYDVAAELGITLPRDQDYEISIPGYKEDIRIKKVTEEILGNITFKHPELLEEALTHPSCIHEDVPCYQRLEWVGDAVLCLFARNWIFHQYPDLKVGELVILEATMVCNETLAYLSISNGLQKYLNHRDVSLPAKFEEFEHLCNGRGLWATDPPKCLSDVVESVFGAVFVDAGLSAATKMVEHMMMPVIKALTSALAMVGKDVRSKARAMVHPKQYVHELGGGIMSVKSWKEEIFALKRACPVWKDGGLWGEAQRDGSNNIGVLESFGIDIIGIEEKSSHVARNRACAITMEVFKRNPELIENIKRLGNILQHQDKDQEAGISDKMNRKKIPL